VSITHPCGHIASAARPEPVVFTIQGDGDLFGEGVLEVVQAVARGERITVICVNNGLNAETGSQMTPATIPGQRTNTSINGRDVELDGEPLRVAELIAGIDGAVFVARGSVHSPVEVKRVSAYIKRAFESQRQGRGFSYVEILTMCPSGWHLDPVQSLDYIANEMTKYHPAWDRQEKTNLRDPGE
jgi:2-oxoglutarate/2-oxoacid ferredoxin oxidoreductase subunit beta